MPFAEEEEEWRAAEATSSVYAVVKAVSPLWAPTREPMICVQRLSYECNAKCLPFWKMSARDISGAILEAARLSQLAYVR